MILNSTRSYSYNLAMTSTNFTPTQGMGMEEREQRGQLHPSLADLFFNWKEIEMRKLKEELSNLPSVALPINHLYGKNARLREDEVQKKE